MSEQTDPFVPSSAQPTRKTEWTGHYWYVLRSFALQARPDLSKKDRQALVALFANLGPGLPCTDCKRHYAELMSDKRWRYTEMHASDPAAGLAYIQVLRAKIQGDVDSGAAGGVVPPAAKLRHGVPSTPYSYFGGACPVHQHTPAALTSQEAAIEAALARTAELRSKRQCGCADKPAPLRPPEI